MFPPMMVKPQAATRIESLPRRYTMDELEALAQYYRLADKLIEKASKDDLAECAKMLALNSAHYASRYGELPMEGAYDFLNAEVLTPEQVKLVAEGLRTFVGMLGNVLRGFDEQPMQ
jgi:hypothetical protein